MPETAWVGLAVSSQNASVASRVQFMDLGNTTQPTEVPWTHVRESATPSSRRTGLVISEIQYNPGPLPGGTNGVEFIEIANHGDIFQELTGWRLTGGVEFAFPDGFKLEAGAHVVVSGNPDALRVASGTAPVLGPWTGSLNNAGDVVELRDNIGAIKLHLEYSPDAPWPVAADGTGHSLVLVSPSYGEEDPRAWAASWPDHRRYPTPSGGGAGAALATVVGQTLLSPLLSSLSDALGQRVSLALYPTYVSPEISFDSNQTTRRLPPQLVLGAEIGYDLSDRVNLSLLAAPNRTDIPPQMTLNYKASELINIEASVDSQGSWGSQLRLFLRF
jgi:hypothetical protein